MNRVPFNRTNSQPSELLGHTAAPAKEVCHSPVQRGKAMVGPRALPRHTSSSCASQASKRATCSALYVLTVSPSLPAFS
eukprot:6988943-Lingulodinium_polyedra.AAC.1